MVTNLSWFAGDFLVLALKALVPEKLLVLDRLSHLVTLI